MAKRERKNLGKQMKKKLKAYEKVCKTALKVVGGDGDGDATAAVTAYVEQLKKELAELEGEEGGEVPTSK